MNAPTPTIVGPGLALPATVQVVDAPALPTSNAVAVPPQPPTPQPTDQPLPLLRLGPGGEYTRDVG